MSCTLLGVCFVYKIYIQEMDMEFYKYAVGQKTYTPSVRLERNFFKNLELGYDFFNIAGLYDFPDFRNHKTVIVKNIYSKQM